jgi:hypothetical protein
MSIASWLEIGVNLLIVLLLSVRLAAISRPPSWSEGIF